MKTAPQAHSWRGFSVRTFRQALRTFRPAFKGERRRVIWAMVLPLLASLMDLAKPWPMKFVLDELVPARGRGVTILGLSGITLAGAAAVAFIGITAASGFTSVRSTVASAGVVQRVTVRIRRQVFEHLHRLAFPFHQSSNTGELLERLLGDVDGVRRLIFTSWVSMIERTVLFGGGLIAMAFIDVRFALLAVLPLPLYWLVVVRSSRKLREVVRGGRRRRSRATAIATESLSLIKVVKAYANEQTAVDRFARETDVGEEAESQAAKISAHLSFYSDLLSGAGVALVLFFGAMQVLRGTLSPGFLVVLTSYAGSLFRPLRKMSKEGGYLSSASVSAERLMEVLEIMPEDSQSGLPAPAFRGDIDFRDVTFTHGGGVEALKGLSFSLPAGSLALLVGPNGAGKSTAFSVLLRLLTPDSGEVLLDGQRVDIWRLDDYRRKFSYVPQEIQLFSGTVRENVLYGRPDASDEEVERAAREALLDEVVARLPEGYDERVGEGGSTLSGGEARRLMLARAALRDARILLFDEPFTGLDKSARETVAGAIRRIAAGRTALLISHGSIEELDPDVVVEFSDGRCVGQGSPAPMDESPAKVPGESGQAWDQIGDLPRLLDHKAALRLFRESGIQPSKVERDFTGVWAETALVTYKFFSSADGGVELPGYVRTYRNGSAPAVASEWEGRAAGTALGPGVRLLARNRSVLFLFPNDEKLAELERVSDPRFLTGVLRNLGEIPGHCNASGVCIHYSRYRPERRLVLGLSLTDGGGRPLGSAPKFYARHLPSAAGMRLDRLATKLRKDAGFDRAARPVGTALDGGVFIEEAVEGRGLIDAIVAGQADAGILADVVRRFHASGIREGEVRIPLLRLEDSLAVLDELARLEHLRPACRDLAKLLPECLPEPGEDGLLHGDLHPGQIIIGKDGPFLIDLEDVAVGDAFEDVGHLAAHLIYLAGWRQEPLRGQIRDFVHRFVHAYAADPRRRDELGFYMARTFIQRASSAVRRQKEHWEDRSARNLRYAAEVLRGPSP